MTTQSALDTSTRETPSLIASDKAEGTTVYRSNGDKVGTIARVMIEKISGKVAYAVGPNVVGRCPALADECRTIAYHFAHYTTLAEAERVGRAGGRRDHHPSARGRSKTIQRPEKGGNDGSEFYGEICSDSVVRVHSSSLAP
jgi:hypothetical protein